MNIKKSIEALNTLVQINNDRMSGYETAANETEEAELKTLFFQFIQSSRQCKEELESEIKGMNGTPTESTTTEGRFFRTWMDVKSALTGRDRKAILSSCEYGEDAALQVYNNVLTNEVDFLTIEQHKMIYKQYVLLKEDHDKVKILRDIQLEHN